MIGLNFALWAFGTLAISGKGSGQGTTRQKVIQKDEGTPPSSLSSKSLQGTAFLNAHVHHGKIGWLCASVLRLSPRHNTEQLAWDTCKPFACTRPKRYLTCQRNTGAAMKTLFFDGKSWFYLHDSLGVRMTRHWVLCLFPNHFEAGESLTESSTHSDPHLHSKTRFAFSFVFNSRNAPSAKLVTAAESVRACVWQRNSRSQQHKELEAQTKMIAECFFGGHSKFAKLHQHHTDYQVVWSAYCTHLLYTPSPTTHRLRVCPFLLFPKYHNSK